MLVSHLADQSGVALSKAVVLRELRRRDTITRAVLDAAPNPIALLDDGRPAGRRQRAAARGPAAAARAAGVRDVAGQAVARRDRGLPAPGGSSRATSRASTRSRSACTAASSSSRRHRAARGRAHEGRVLRPRLARAAHAADVDHRLPRAAARRRRRDGDDPAAAAERAQFLAVVDRNARRLLRLVGDLLFVAQVEAGKLSLERDRRRPRRDRPRERRGGPRRAPREAGVELDARGARPRRSSAATATVSPRRSTTSSRTRSSSRPRAAASSCALAREDDCAVLEVTDTGIGISPADLEQPLPALLPRQRAHDRGDPGRRPRADDRPGDRRTATAARSRSRAATARARRSASSCRCAARRGRLRPAARRRSLLRPWSPGLPAMSAAMTRPARPARRGRRGRPRARRARRCAATGFEVIAVADGEAALRAAAERPPASRSSTSRCR